MFVALTGTPGTGKTSISKILSQNGFNIIDLNETAIKNNFVIGIDKKRKTKIIDIKKVGNFLKKNYDKNYLHIIEGHWSHLITIVEKIIILRCAPKKLRERLNTKNWKLEKVNENVEAEALDIILCESVEIHNEKDIFEIDTTNRSMEENAKSVLEIIKNNFKPLKKYNIGQLDWSEEIFNLNLERN